jgi:hypothetical protein
VSDSYDSDWNCLLLIPLSEQDCASPGAILLIAVVAQGVPLEVTGTTRLNQKRYGVLIHFGEEKVELICSGLGYRVTIDPKGEPESVTLVNTLPENLESLRRLLREHSWPSSSVARRVASNIGAIALAPAERHEGDGNTLFG